MNTVPKRFHKLNKNVLKTFFFCPLLDFSFIYTLTMVSRTSGRIQIVFKKIKWNLNVFLDTWASGYTFFIIKIIARSKLFDKKTSIQYTNNYNSRCNEPPVQRTPSATNPRYNEHIYITNWYLWPLPFKALINPFFITNSRCNDFFLILLQDSI